MHFPKKSIAASIKHTQVVCNIHQHRSLCDVHHVCDSLILSLAKQGCQKKSINFIFKNPFFHLLQLPRTDLFRPCCFGRTRWAEGSTRRKPTSASWRTSTSGTGNFPSPRSTTWPPATAEHRRATSSPGQRTTLKYLAEQPNGPLSLAVRTTELRGKREKRGGKKRKRKKASPYF